MPFTVYDGIYAYAKQANSDLYQGCLTSIFNNPANQVFTPKGKVTKVRQYSAGMAGNYSTSKGWMTTYGSGRGIEWIEYAAEYDRAKVLVVDALDEEQSYANGMTPSIALLQSDFMNNQISREIDATNIAKWYGQIPANNKFTDSTAGYQIDKENILQTINNLDRQVFNSGYDRDTVLFMSTEAYANLVAAIQDKCGFANPGMLTQRQISVIVDTGLSELIPGGVGKLKVNINVEVYGRFLIIRVPDERMYSNIIMYSGDPTEEGQEAGGYVPDLTNPNFCNIQLMAIPIEAAFTNVRYIVDNFLYPAAYPGASHFRTDLRRLNQKMFGRVEINNAGINQKGNNFEYDIRVVYGGSLFNNRARNCFAVTGDIGAQPPVTSITLAVQGGGGNTVQSGSSITITATVKPDEAANPGVTYSVIPGTGTATIGASTGILVGGTEGTVTVVGTALDGSGVTGKLEITVTAAG